MPQHPPIDLGNEKPFILGTATVVPAACEVVAVGEVQSLEPRIMQVLVVLAQADGRVVSRTELVDRCWGGRIVGENAVNRVMSRIRHLADTIGADSFRLETITKVGYRLTAVAPPVPPTSDTAAAPATPDALPGRRYALVGGLAMIGIAAIVWSTRDQGTAREPSPEARLLYAKGKEAQGQLLLSQTKQSVAYFREAVRLVPDYADAWGGLAMSYANLAEQADDTEQPAVTQRLISAATRAREIEPGNADADVALILVTPHFRHWAKVERDCREGLLRHPGHVRLQGKLPRIMCDTGRWREGAKGFEQMVRIAPYRTALHNQLALALWGAGRLEDAERTIGHAVALWPEHPAIRATQFDFLALTGRPAAALQLVAGGRPLLADARAGVARALATRGAGDVEAAAAGVVTALGSGALRADVAAPYLAALGRPDAAFAALADYYLGPRPVGGGPRVPPAPLARRETDILFGPAMAAVRNDRRFAALTAAIGLDTYWQTTGTVPDWRR